jgi:hypothetical protein
MDWASLRQAPSDNPNIVATNRNTWLINAQRAAQAEATESERNVEAAMKAAREAENSLVVNMYPMVGNVWENQTITDFILQRETIQEQGDMGANDMQMWEQEQILDKQQQNWFTGAPQFEEKDDKSKEELMLRYNIIDIITISNNTNKQVVYNCNLLIEAIFARVDQSYTIINLKKNGGNVPGGWEYIYIVCELILNTEYFVALIANGVFNYELFTQFYDSMYGYLSSTIIQIQIDNTDRYILGIIDHFNGLFAATQEGIQIKYEFIMNIAYHLPISFLFANRVEVEFPMLVDYMVKENPMLLDYINKKIEQDYIKQKNIEQEYQFCLTQPGSDESKCHQYGSCLVTHLGANPNAISYCRSQPITAGGNNYKNNSIKKLKVKKRATKRRQHKSQKHKNRKKHKSQKQKYQRKYKSKNQRKHKSIFNKTLKRKI